MNYFKKYPLKPTQLGYPQLGIPVIHDLSNYVWNRMLQMQMLMCTIGHQIRWLRQYSIDGKVRWQIGDGMEVHWLLEGGGVTCFDLVQDSANSVSLLFILSSLALCFSLLLIPFFQQSVALLLLLYTLHLELLHFTPDLIMHT